MSESTRRTFVSSALAAPPVLSSLTAAHENAGQGSICDVGGIRVGHFTLPQRPTGCTVLLFDNGAVAGVDVRGSAPGTRETDLLNPNNSVQQVNAIVLSGGSAFGLDTATGVMRYLSERNIGFHLGSIVVPIVPAAIIFDLELGDAKVHPDAEAGYQACQAASNSHVPEGNVGAGAGATVGKLSGMQSAMKSGIGTASLKIGNSDIIVGAIVVVNAVGDIIDPALGKIVAGALAADRKMFRNSMAQLIAGRIPPVETKANTTLGVIATNAALDKTEATKMAQMAHDGLARAINPVHTMYDGDTIFSVATGTVPGRANVSVLGAIGAEVISRAVLRAVMQAAGLPGLPAVRDL